METQDMMFENWLEGINPDRCFWAQHGKFANCFLMVIRIFYESGTPAMEEMGNPCIIITNIIDIHMASFAG